ncbi:MAG: hypothetical protein ACI4KJ_05680 [Anaerovoracaceae bacterium]
MGRFRAVIRLIKERFEALSLRKGIAALCILTAVTMFSFAAPFAINFSYAETAVDGQEASQEEGNTEANQNIAQQPEGGQTEANGTAESTDEPQTTAEDTTYENDATKLKELLEDSNNKWAEVTINDGIITKISTSSPLQCLIVLSNVAPELYETADITLNFTGESDLSSGSVTVDSQALTFEGLGSREHSFKGNLVPGQATLKLSRPLFNSVTFNDNTEHNYKLNWFARGGCDSIFASEVIAEGSPSKLNLTITPVKDESVVDNPVTRLNAPAVGDTKGNLDINAGYIIDDPNTLQINITNDGNAGLLVNSHSDGTLKLTSSGLSFSGAVIKSLNENAGFLVGKVYKTDGGAETSLEITNSYITQSDDDDVKISAGQSVGGLIGAVDTANVTIDNDIDLKGVSVNGVSAGGFVGYSKDAVYNIAQDKNITPSLSVGGNASSQYAGGLFGVYETSLNTAINMADFDFSQRVTLAAKTTDGIAGGIAGKIVLREAATESGSRIGRLEITMPDKPEDTSLAAGAEESGSETKGEGQGTEGETGTSNEGSETNESSEGEGGLLTNLLGEIEGLAVDADAGKYGLKSTLSTNSNVKAYGGVVGQLTGTDDLKTGMTINGMNVWARSEGKAKYKSGIAAIVGTEDGTLPVALILNNAVTDIENADTSDKSTGAFGGAAAFIGSKSVVYDKDSTTITTTGTGVTAGGGLIGIAGKGSAVRLAGTTDISGVSFESSDQLNRIGQLVGVQDSALVYADGSGSDASESGGWDYIRSGTAQFDDIGNYGQVYRIKDTSLIKMNEQTYQVSLVKSDKTYKNSEPPQISEGAAEGSEEGAQTGNETSETGAGDPEQPAEGEPSALAEGASDDAVNVEIANLPDFARLAITIQTEGYFSGYDTIDTSSWEILLNDTLTFINSINLKGTGITGITRDSISAGETPAVFTGKIIGNDNTITLSIGEAYGKMKSALGDTSPVSSADRCGKVYRHNRLGLFSYGNGSAENLTIKGKINFEALEAGIAAGAYSAYSNGGEKTFTGCSFKPEITYKTNEKLCYVGGVIGMLDGTAKNKTTFTGGTRIAPAISIDATTSKGVDITGGAIGYVSGSCPAVIESDNAILSAYISNTNNTYTTSLAGGYIGIIMPSATTNYNRVSVTFNDTKMVGHKVILKANTATGGLLGYMWADTNVCFTGNVDSYGLSVNDTESKQTELNAETSTAGGLIYRASGKWTINDRGINLGGSKISGVKTSLGLLVCRGANGDENVGDKTCTSGALYLELTDPWNTAYPLSSSENSGEGYVHISCSPSTFDEFVAFSMKEQGSFKNNESGVISLQTSGNNGKVIMDGSGINTYINRSSYGLNNNGSSRYYYNLDEAIKSIGTSNNVIDTPEELLIWSVGIYAGTNIKQYFEKNDTKITGTTKTTIGSTGDTPADLDMRGYSYYPVTVNNRSINIRNANITFYNKEIEDSEKANGNKLTRVCTQHYAMHCGLFRDFNNSSSVEGDYSISCQNLKLGGSVGMIEQSSGALISGTIEGFVNLGTNMFSVDLETITLNQLVVSGVDSNTAYAPLLINQSGSYSSININNLVYNSSNPKVTVATSLIGNVGLVDGNNNPVSTQLSVTFNRVKIPSKNNSEFTKASLLNSFSYEVNSGVGSAVYNFTENDAVTDKIVTYGKEIDGSTEFKGNLQVYYFDINKLVKNNDGKEANEEAPVFGAYLPYVYKGYTDGNGFHEIAVNQKFSDITLGCGTYMDPFVIENADQLASVAKFINNPGSGVGMSITIVKNQADECKRLSESSPEGNNHITYQKNGGKWIATTKENGKVVSVSNNTMHRYLQSAYYYISNDITLSDEFPGLGNTSNPFRGVITGRLGGSEAGDKNKITITCSSLMGFIPCSYGSVIKDLEVEYMGSNTIQTNTIRFQNASDYSPGAYFGGVIGLILGGDNIIDNVTVGMDASMKLTFTGGSKHKIPAGGYIGAISGGGVLFRNTNGEGLTDSWLDSSMKLSADKDAKQSLYVNPIIGRVISGFAFSEGNNCELDNTEKNYKINSITKEDSQKPEIETEEIGETNAPITAVKSAQGLMILSAIIQSGASSGPMNKSTHTGTLPYFGIEEGSTDDYKFGNNKYGKVRNASYKYIGQPGAAGGAADFAVSKNDDMHAPGLYDTAGKPSAGDLLKLVNTSSSINPPYLVKNYATIQTGYICAPNASLMRVKFDAGKTYDMTTYGPAYVGLTGRYKSNSVATGVSNAIDRAVPYLICVDGNNKGKGSNCTISVKMNINEYSDDDFRCAGAGALFSTAYWYYGGKGGSSGLAGNDYKMLSGINLKDSEVGVYYYDNQGSSVIDLDGKIGGAGVGGLIGNISCVQQDYPTALISDISVSGVKVHSPYSAGSIVGSVGNKGKSFNDSTHTIGSGSGSLLYYHLIDCTYTDLEVYGSRFAGGFVGYSNPKDSTTGNGIEVTKEHVTGRNSIITSDLNKGLSGGITGYQQGSFIVNDPEYKALTSGGQEYYSTNKEGLKAAELSNVKISGNITGGFAGEVQNSILVKNLSIIDDNDSDKYEGLIGNNCIGGVVGRTQSGVSTNGYTFDRVVVKDIKFTSYGSNNGGIVGYIQKNNNELEPLAITDSEVSGCRFSKAQDAGSTIAAMSGGAIGNIEDANVNVKVKNFASKNNSFTGTTNSAGLFGVANGNIEGNNILLSDNDLSSCNNSGLLAGTLQAGARVRIAGISIRKNSADTTKELYGSNMSSAASSYIAFADYKNKAAEGLSDKDKAKPVLGTVQKAPYVATSPLIGTGVKAGDEYLFGDAIGSVDASGSSVVTAYDILAESRKEDNPTRYKYSNLGKIGFNFDQLISTNFDQLISTYFNQLISTYNKNNESSLSADVDIPVVRVAGGDTSGIEKYLNIVTNGGYSDAKALNPSTEDGISHVSAEVNVYEWNNEKKTFIKSTSAKPSIVINKPGTNAMSFRATTEYDNGRGRFSLITVTFSESGGEYKVHVPVIVRRILEIDYTATLNYGTVFKQSEYSSLGNDAHVLESFGNSVTALITYKYNSAYGSSTEYGWDSYLAAGGSMGEVEKNISFSSPLPSGTKLSLVDCLSGKVYTATHDGSGTIALTEFSDSSENSYQNKWLSELMKVSAIKASDGRWVKCVSDVEAYTAKDKNGTKYRLAGESDASAQKYTLTVEKDAGKEIQPEESFYLVINVPLNKSTENLSANGYISGSAGCGDVPVSMNYTIRPDSSRDNHQNTASTYSFLSGYTHSITDGSSDIDKAGSGHTMIPLQKEGQSGRYINVEAQDKISFNSDQNYNDKDSLFYKLDINLLQYSSESNTSSYFATGTEGTAKMFVKIGENYYHYSGGSWIKSKSKTAAAQIPWKATAENKGELSLTLKDENGKALDLAGVRAIAQNSGSEFAIVTEMDLHLSDPAVENSIMGSLSNGKNEYTKLNYRSVLAVREESLSYSNTSASCLGIVGYYRPKAGSSIITYSANDIKQLGINCSELDTADGNIETTGTYSFEDVVNAGEIIDSADRIVYSLRLFKRKDTDGSYHQICGSEEELKEYLTVGCTQLGDPVYTTDANGYCYFTWTDNKTDGGFRTAEAAGKRFTVNIPVEVFTDNVESLEHIFANYRLVLTAEMYNGNKRIDYPFNSRIVAGSNDTGTLDDHSDYVTYTLTRVATDELINNPSGTGN